MVTAERPVVGTPAHRTKAKRTAIRGRRTGDEDRVKPGRIGQIHGLHLISGPTGSGKTALAVKIAHGYVGTRCSFCGPHTECGRAGGAKWHILTNMTNAKVLEWAEPLESLQQISEVEGGHVIVLIDEIHEYFDSRRAMRHQNIKGAGLLSQARKRSVKIIATTQSIDKVDGRLVSEAKSIRSVWNPDGEAKTIGAVTRIMADGKIAPWKRHDSTPIRQYFNTTKTREFYETEEIIDDADLLGSTKGKMLSVVGQKTDKNGEIQIVSHAMAYIDAVKATLDMVVSQRYTQVIKRAPGTEQARKEGGFYVTTPEIVEQTNRIFQARPPMTSTDIDASMYEMGRVANGGQGFWITVQAA